MIRIVLVIIIATLKIVIIEATPTNKDTNRAHTTHPCNHPRINCGPPLLGSRVPSFGWSTVPERMARLVVYPVPSALRVVWGLMRPFLAPKTAEKILMLGGADGRATPCPVCLGEFVSLEALREADRPRHAAIEKYRHVGTTC